jgi:hypothetical protein
MTKKNTTLNDLTRFLQTESVLQTSSISDTEDFFEKNPLSLVLVDADGIISTSKAEPNITEKFIDSKALQKTSFEDVQEQIKTLALENKISVQQVMTTLFMRTVSPISVTNVFDMSLILQKNYMQYWMNLQKSWKL